MTTSTTPRPPKRNLRTLSRRLQKAGLSREFVRGALLPSWWERSHDKDTSLLPEVEIAVARFLRTPLSVIQDPQRPLQIASVNAKLRKPKDVDQDELRPAIFAAKAIAEAVVRNLKGAPAYVPLPSDPSEWRGELLSGGREAVSLRTLVDGLWRRGIPVIHLPDLNLKKFRGMACWADNRPVILLAWGGISAPIFLTDAAHEAGHIARGHVTPERLMIDEEGEDDGDDLEREANAYQQKLIGTFPTELEKLGAKDVDGTVLAQRARPRAKELGLDAGLLVHFWAVKTRAFSAERYALRVLDKLDGPDRLIEFAQSYIDFEGASETDANLLRCVVASAPSHEVSCR